MRKILIYLSVIVLITACATPKNVVKATGEVQQQALSDFAKKYNEQLPNFNHLQIKSKIRTNFGGKKMAATLKLYIQNQQRIWANASLFGITGARINITPTKVQGYNVLEKTYFDDDFAYLNQKLKVNFITYERLQQILTGQLFLVKDMSQYQISLTKDNQYVLKYKNNEKIKKNPSANEFIHEFYLDGNYRLRKVEITDPKNNTDVTVTYDEWQVFDHKNFPSLVKVLINGKQKDEIELDYTNFVFEDSNPPFNLPENYKKQEIK